MSDRKPLRSMTSRCITTFQQAGTLVQIPADQSGKVLQMVARLSELSDPIQKLVGPQMIVPARSKKDLVKLSPIKWSVPNGALRFDA